MIEKNLQACPANKNTEIVPIDFWRQWKMEEANEFTNQV